MMAAGYECMAEGEPHAANWLLSSLDPYAMFTACNQDFPLMIIPVLAANLETDPDRLYDAIRKHLEAESRRAAKAAKDGATVSPQPGPEQPPTLGPAESGNGTQTNTSSSSSPESQTTTEVVAK